MLSLELSIIPVILGFMFLKEVILVILIGANLLVLMLLFLFLLHSIRTPAMNGFSRYLK